MANPTQKVQLVKFFRAVACSGVILGPCIYCMARPEETLKYRFIRPTNANGDFLKVNSSYSRLATEMAYRLRIPDQMRRAVQFDIRPCLHTGIEFDVNGQLTPLFDGIVYLMIPHWANISSLDDLKNIQMNIAGQELDFSRIDLSRIDQSKLKFNFSNQEKKSDEKPPLNTEAEVVQTSNSWFTGLFGSSPHPTEFPVQQPSPIIPLSREALLVQKLLETFCLSDEAKKYALADQFDIASGPWSLFPWFFVAGSFFLPFSLYTRLRMQFQTRFKRFLFFHALLFNGLLCFYLAPFGGRLINMQVSRIRDSTTTSLGLDILEGGMEYLEKQLERNRLLRELLPNGKDLFDADGERTKTRVKLPIGGLSIPLYHWNPLVGYRLKRLKAKMNILMTMPEAEARKTIFKPLPRSNLLDNSFSSSVSK